MLLGLFYVQLLVFNVAMFLGWGLSLKCGPRRSIASPGTGIAELTVIQLIPF